jgi:N,N'-diacetyllegionaminate synthase
MSRVRVIAEIGENHGGDIELAAQMIERAAAAGADVVKFQSYRGADVAPDDPEREWFTQVELSEDDHRALLELARAHDVEFLSAPFSLERARLLVEDLGLTAVKVASSEMLNFGLLDYLNGRVETVYISTGLADLDEVRVAVDHLGDVPDVTVMHCVTQYPLADELANLNAVRTLSDALPGRQVGYSDHTIGTTAPLLAVALGATTIEKHFTVDRSLPGTDHVLSLLPDELERMVGEIRRAELMLGSGHKRPAEAELEIREFVRGRFPKTALQREG